MTEDLGTLLRTLRDRADLTQEQVAERSGVSVRTIRRLESGGSTNHRMGTVNLLADALGLEEGDRLRLAAALTGSSAAAPGAGRQSQGMPGPAPAPPPRPPVHGTLAEASQELATEVRRRWRREEAQRRVHDPFPLPVRWKPAPALLTDRAENIQRLGPGGTPREVDLGGDLRSMAEVYLRIPSGRLVILGRAGSGKSILTIRLVLDLLESPAPHPRVPVIFSIGSWDPSTTALRDWLIGRLLRDHPHLARRSSGGATLAAVLVDADLILPVLDGFDEIAEGLRRDALDALNATSTPLVLTSRREEYAEAVRAAHAPLVWAGGIELTDLTLDDLADYLPRTTRGVPSDTSTDHGTGVPGSPWDAVLTELRTGRGPAHANLAAVLTTPLMVILARTLYSETPDRDPAELLDTTRFPSVKSLDEHLLAGFVPAVYRRRAPERDAAGHQPRAPYADSARAERRLGYLAHHLVRLDRERQDLAWWQLGDSLPRSTRTMAFVLASVVSITLADWLVGLLLTPLPLHELLLQGSLMGPAAGLAFGAVYALADRSRGGAAVEPARIRLTLRATHESLGRRPLRTFAVRFGHGLIGGAVMGIGCACALTLGRALAAGTSVTDPRIIEGTLINMLVLGLIFGSAAGLVFGLMAALEVPVDVAAAATPISLLASNRATAGRQFLILAPAFTLAIAFGGYLIVHLLQGTMGPLNWGVQDSLFIGAVGGLGGAASYVLAFTAWGHWIVLARVWLPLAGRLPWDPAAFLDDAYHRGGLRQTGAVYQFRHVRLQHHLGRAFRGRHRDFAPATFTPPSTGDR
ncbi:helix-turn-helix domain-containing protein [Streptomyces subrutilus]|uniref:XRE family transcriptional regulator n=1 Tax=Streptomyces subrutilus TaxID=36818 RepID=A0A1E5PLH7_9ACTN|nr:helix-turn-helix transcriptional regulator [Streptomyces subrutilus]OEJ30370.1 XRE family transcriptional regulator [Streptomyces subrutilus]